MPRNVTVQSFYARSPQHVAIGLLGTLLVSTIGGRRASGIIVETEAYLASGDSACHGARGPMAGNATMFGPAGVAYVYTIHSRHCFNVVTDSENWPSAVLIRAVQPVEGIALMCVRRSTDNLKNLCSGPAKLCQALAIDRQHDGLDLTRRRTLWIESSESMDQVEFRATRRIGVTSATQRRLRFVIRNSPFASGPAALR